MPKPAFLFQRNLISIALICFFFTLFKSIKTRNSFYDLDLSIQTLIPSVTGYRITGNAVGDSFANRASPAGDINGDGYDDIILGAYTKNSNQGAVYVIYGGEESSFLNLDLSTTSLNPLITGFMITGSAAGDAFGWSVSTAGDINNDGYDDIIVGAYAKNSNQGAAYVIYGGVKSSMSNIVLSSTTTLSSTSKGFTITGNAAGDGLGYSVSTAGDINGDGYDDIVIGAPSKNSDQGVAYVIYGGPKSAMSNVVLSSTPLNPTSTGFMVTGNAAGDQFGYSVSTAGDINNDGYDDIVIAAYGKSSSQGAAYVIYGGVKSAMSNIVLSSSTTLSSTSKGFMMTGSAAGDGLGYFAGTAGDIDNDGYDDIIVGADIKSSNKGAAYVIYGGPKSTMSNIALSSPLDPASTGFMITGSAANDFFGHAVSTAGDFNKDGYADIMVGAYGKSSSQGVVYVIYGGPKSTMSNLNFGTQTLNPSTTGFTMTGNAAGDLFGVSARVAGDFNKDGYPDIIVGARGKNSNQGVAYLIYASCSEYCRQCSSESVCTQCKNPYRLYQSKCFASCPDGTLATSVTLCEDCPAHCKHCSSTTACTECNSPYILYQSQCLDSCPDGMFLSTTTTTSTCQYCQSPCSKCTSLSACTECISPLILYESMCFPSCPRTMYNFNNICKNCSSYCYSCTSEDSCQVCFPGFTLSNSLCIFSSQEVSKGAQEKATQVIASVTRGIGSVLCVGSAIFPFSALVSKIVQNTRYLNLSVTSDLTEVYETWNTDLISWDIPNVFSNADHFKASPSFFAQYDVGSPFLVNFWPTMLNIAISLGTFVACILLVKVFEHEKYDGWAYSLVRKLIAGSFNFALVQAYACMDDILFYLVLDAKTNPFNSFFSWTSMICAVLFLAIGCFLVFFNFWTVYKYQSIKNQGTREIDAFNEKNKYWELFYSDFIENDFWCQSFFAILIIRSATSSLIITVFYDYPLLQTSYFLMIDGAILLFLYFKNPFNTLRGKLAQFYYEIITLLVHFCAFILSLQDTFNNPSDTVRKIMSTGILYLNTALISGAIGFMFIEIYKTISEKNKAARLKRSIPEDHQETQNLTQTERPFYPSETIKNQKRNSELIYMESNFNADSSRELNMDPSYRSNQNRRPIRHRHPSHLINPGQFSDN